MRTSRAGLELIKSFEGFREAAARLPDGRWTIGYGHVRSAREGVTITEQDAEDLLRFDLQGIEEAVLALVYSPLNQSQFDALASLVFNISPGQFKDSEILRSLNAGEYIAAAAGFDAWRKARINGRLIVVDALVRRRAMEKAMFLEPPDGRPAAPTPLVTPEIDPAALAQAPRDGVVDAIAPLKSGPASVAPRTPAPAAKAANDDLSVSAITQAIGNMVSRPGNGAANGLGSEPSATPEEASKVVAARIARILKRAEQSIENNATAETAAIKTKAARPAPVVQDIIEELPDFDAPVQPRTNAPRPRIFIDDTEVFDPGRDPAALFAEGEVKERAVSTFSSPVNAIDPRMIRVAPWIAIAVLSVLGLAIGLVDSFRSVGIEAAAQSAGASPTVLAVSGLMLIMSIYFIITRTADPEH
ncbi:MAG: glycoside hydrolase family protein [Alphaproteobacteria bacterium]